MKVVQNGRFVLAGCACLLMVGCGTTAVTAPPPKSAAPRALTAKAPKATPKPTARPVSPDMVAYAKTSLPTLLAGIKLTSALVGQMQHTSISVLGKACALAGGNLANNRDAFALVSPPAGVKQVRASGKNGYSHALGATDECGIAADSNSSSEMSRATRDLSNALGEMERVRSILTAWNAKH